MSGATPRSSAQQLPARVEVSATPVRFEYQGSTGLSVRGPISGRSYRFNGRGEQVGVDARDAPSLRAVPGLRAVR